MDSSVLIFNFQFPEAGVAGLVLLSAVHGRSLNSPAAKAGEKSKAKQKSKKAKPSKKGAKSGGNPLQKGRSLAPKSGEMGAPPLKGEIFLA